MQVIKVIFDTNIFISAAVFKGKISSLVEFWKQEKFILLISPQIYDEYFEILSRSEFNLDIENIKEISDLITSKCFAVEPKTKLNIIKHDPDDNKFLECAVTGKVDYIVSGDAHLLKLKKYKNIKIITASEFLKILKK